jgi:hypothetical protein
MRLCKSICGSTATNATGNPVTTPSLNRNLQSKAAAKRRVSSTIEQPTFQEILQNKYMGDFIEDQKEADRAQFVHSNLLGQTRVFQNFINTNSNILRRFKQGEKLTVMRQMEDKEREIHKKHKIGVFAKPVESEARVRTTAMTLGLKNNVRAKTSENRYM